MKKTFTKKVNLNQQNGAVLLTALILLVMLTLLGLSSMSSTTMEERMASNTQLINRAFQAAATGIEIVFADGNAFDTRLTRASDGTAGDAYAGLNDTTIGGGSATSYDAVATYNSVFVQNIPPPRGSGYDSTFNFYYFDLSATGCVVVDDNDNDCANTAIAAHTQHLGAYQVGKAQ